MFVVCCSLVFLFVDWFLFVIGCVLFVDGCLLFVVRCLVLFI